MFQSAARRVGRLAGLNKGLHMGQHRPAAAAHFPKGHGESTAAMMQALNTELGTGRVNPDMARRLLIVASVALNQNPAAGVVTRD